MERMVTAADLSAVMRDVAAGRKGAALGKLEMLLLRVNRQERDAAMPQTRSVQAQV